METIANKRRKLNVAKIVFSGKQLSSAKALEDVVPIRWSEEVLNGEKKATVFPLKTKE